MEEKEKNREQEEGYKYICPVCGYILKVYSPDEKFSCPLCGYEGEGFTALDEEKSMH